jgi:type II secretory pathway pseudopilin PulG
MNAATHGLPQRCSAAGMSLVELILLVVAFAVLIQGLLSGVVSLNSQRKRQEEQAMATAACRDVLENLRREDVALLAAENGHGFAVGGLNGSGIGLKALPGDADGLPGSIRVVPERTYGTEVLYRVTVAVDWDGTDRSHFHLTTLMGRRR